MKYFEKKLTLNSVFVCFVVAVSIVLGSCAGKNNNKPEPKPGSSLGIVSVPNLRDMGGYKTADGSTIARGLVYRSNQLFNISESDMQLIAKLNLKNEYDLRTASERNAKPDELPKGVNNVWLDVMADLPNSEPANLEALLSDPKNANLLLGDGKIEKKFEKAYRDCVSLPSAQKAFSELFKSIGDESKLPVLFHCATGKDRTGWAAAAFLTLLGVPMETVKQDYLRSNDNILPMYDSLIKQFVANGGTPSIPQAVLGVKEEYLNAAFDEVNIKYGSMENYFSKALGISVEQQNAIRKLYLKK